MRLDEFIGVPTELTLEEFLAWIDATPGQVIKHNGRAVGTIYRHPKLGKIYVTRRLKSKHLFRRWGSVGISRDVIIKLIKLQVDKIVIWFKDTGEVFMATPKKFLMEGRELWFGYEADSQLHLPLSEMEKFL